MTCTEAYKEHIMYTFHGFCKVIIHNATITAWRDQQRRHKREISLEYLTEEKFYPLGTTDEYFTASVERGATWRGDWIYLISPAFKQMAGKTVAAGMGRNPKRIPFDLPHLYQYSVRSPRFLRERIEYQSIRPFASRTWIVMFVREISS